MGQKSNTTKPVQRFSNHNYGKSADYSFRTLTNHLFRLMVYGRTVSVSGSIMMTARFFSYA